MSGVVVVGRAVLRGRDACLAGVGVAVIVAVAGGSCLVVCGPVVAVSRWRRRAL